MTTETAQNVLHRKVSQGNRLRDASAMTPARALRLSLGRVADEMWGLAVQTQGIRSAVLDQQSALAEVQPDDLILVAAGPGGRFGLIAVERGVLGALTEIQTMGTVFDRPVPERRYTATDGSIAWLYVTRVITAVAATLAEHPQAAQWQGYRFEERAEDIRTAGLYLNSPQYALSVATLSLAEGKRTGDLRLILPLHRQVPPPRARLTGDVAEGNGFALLPAPVTVQLCRFALPLTRACRLKPGDLLELPDHVLDMAIVRAAGGHQVARGRLGQMNGFRAVRLDMPPRPGAGEEGTAPQLEQEEVADLLPALGAAPETEQTMETPPLELEDMPQSEEEDEDEMPFLAGGALEDFPDWEETE